MKTCSINGCDDPAKSRGWCRAHYMRWYQTGDTQEDVPLVRRQPKIPGRKCEVPGCDAEAWYRELCMAHYHRRRKTGDVRADVPLRQRREGCTVEGCTQEHYGRGLCGLHWSRQYRDTDSYRLGIASRPRCVVDGCNTVQASESLCRTHWARKKEYGDPTFGPPVGNHGKPHPSHLSGTCVCCRCKQEQDLSEFQSSRHKKSGHVAHCKSCDAADRASKRDTAYEGSRRRRARLRGLSADDVESGLTRDALRAQVGDECAYCRIAMDFGSYPRGLCPINYATIDHIVPLSRGGRHVRENVTLACYRCNASKRSSIFPTEWKPTLGPMPPKLRS